MKWTFKNFSFYLNLLMTEYKDQNHPASQLKTLHCARNGRGRGGPCVGSEMSFGGQGDNAGFSWATGTARTLNPIYCYQESHYTT